jgi:hypothetical protein
MAQALKYKVGWPQVQERCRAFWEREIIDRACVSVVVPRRVQIPEPVPRDTEQMLTDIDFLLAQEHVVLENNYYAGEAIPGRNFQIGWLAYGGEPVFTEVSHATFWTAPIIQDWKETPYRFDPENNWHLRYRELYERLWDDCRGKYIPDGPGIHSPVEALSQLRGSVNLCVDLIENAEEVHAAIQVLLTSYFTIQEWRFKLIDADHLGSKSWGVWAPGRHSYITCDFSALIGPGHFREFVMPELEAVTRWLDFSLYHVDGEACIKHVDALLELDSLNCIQFTPGAAGMDTVGAPGTLSYLGLYKRIQRAGKCLLVYATCDDVEALLRELDPRGVWISVRDVPDEGAADRLVSNVEKWSRKQIWPT